MLVRGAQAEKVIAVWKEAATVESSWKERKKAAVDKAVSEINARYDTAVTEARAAMHARRTHILAQRVSMSDVPLSHIEGEHVPLSAERSVPTCSAGGGTDCDPGRRREANQRDGEHFLAMLLLHSLGRRAP